MVTILPPAGVATNLVPHVDTTKKVDFSQQSDEAPRDAASAEPFHSVFYFKEERNCTTWDGLPWHGLCGASTTTPDGKNRKYCGRGWVCPRCAQRAFEYYQPLLEKNLNTLPAVFVTNTIAPDNPDDLASSLAQLSAVRLKATRTGTWDRFRQKNIVGSLRKAEVTLNESGWHPHYHHLYFLKPGTTPDQAAEIGERINHEFVKGGPKAGVSVAGHAQHSMPVMRTPDGERAMSIYPAKSLFYTGGRLGWGRPELPPEHYGTEALGPGDIWSRKSKEPDKVSDSIMEAFEGRSGLADWLTQDLADQRFDELDKASKGLHVFESSNFLEELQNIDFD